jgi:flagellar hook-associated protein 2
MAISSAGIGSGLDVSSIVSQLMALERRPLTALDTKEAKLQSQLTAYGSLKGALSSFQSAVAALANPAKFSAVTGFRYDGSHGRLLGGGGKLLGRGADLAQAHKLKSGICGNRTTVGSGTITIQFGTTAAAFRSI